MRLPIFRSFGLRVTIILILAMLFSGALSNFLIYDYSLKEQFEHLRNNLMTLAKISSLTIDAELIQKIPLNKNGTQTPQYKTIIDELSRIRDTIPKISYIYILVKTEREGIFKFVADVKSSAYRTSKETAYPGEEYDASRFPDLLIAFNSPSADRKLSGDEWGVFLSGYAPIRDKAGKAVAILGVDISAKDVYNLQKEIRNRAILILILGIIISIILGIFISGRIANPVKELMKGAEHIAKGDLKYKVKIKGDDEIAELGGIFNKMAFDLEQYIEELRRTTGEKERMLKELEIAKGIQQSFLPESAPKIEGFDIVATTLPARVVGGDFYDFIPIEEGKIGLAVADVSGKGIPAALFMALSRTLIRASAIGKLSAEVAIKEANRHIIEDTKTNMFVTLFYAILDSKKRDLTYVNAGHNPPLLVRESSGDIVLLKAQGIPLGLSENTDMSVREIELQKGDVVVIYTDGVTEAINKSGEQFEVDRLSKVIRESNTLSSQGIMSRIQEELKVFVGNHPQFDDMTLMVLKAG